MTTSRRNAADRLTDRPFKMLPPAMTFNLTNPGAIPHPRPNTKPNSRHSMACPALPLCGLAITEAERAMPSLTRQLHSLLEKHGMGDEQIMTRMTGCPNGCARPYMAGAWDCH